MDSHKFLTRIQNISDAETQYILHDFKSNVLYSCPFETYAEFSKCLAKEAFTCSRASETLLHGLYMDLTRIDSHALILDITFREGDPGCPTIRRHQLMDFFVEHVCYFLKYRLHALFSHILVVVTARENFEGGLRIHLPEVQLSHDDYVHFFQLLESDIRRNMVVPDKRIALRANLYQFPVVGSNDYRPLALVYEATSYSHYPRFAGMVDWTDEGDSQDSLKKGRSALIEQFPEESLFLKLISSETREEFERDLLELTMPVVAVAGVPRRVYFFTYINQFLSGCVHEWESGFIEDSSFVRCRVTKQCWLRPGRPRFDVRRYLKMNGRAITRFYSDSVQQPFNPAASIWYQRFCNSTRRPASSQAERSFETVADTLRIFCSRFRYEKNPLRILMTRQNGRYFSPVFYALCRHLKEIFPSSSVLAANLRKEVFERDGDEDDDVGLQIHLLQKLENDIDPKVVGVVSEQFTLETVVYCGLKMRETTNYGEGREGEENGVESQMYRAFENLKGYLMHSMNIDEATYAVRWIQKRYFCVAKVVEDGYVWNPFCEEWQRRIEKKGEDDSNETVSKIVRLVWYSLKKYLLRELRESEWSDAWIHDFWKHEEVDVEAIVKKTVVHRVNAILKNLEERKQSADTIVCWEKWLEQTNDGIRDLLLDHKSGNVPEFFMLTAKKNTIPL